MMSNRRGSARFSRWSSAAVVAAAVALSPGVATAAPNRSDPPDVVPLVDCIITHPDGSWTAVFGYDNRTTAPVSIPIGPANQVTPTTYGTPQPTTFDVGVHHAVFTVTVTRGGGPMWHLGSDNLAARQADTACPDATQMPADGNGMGIVMAVAAAGVAGVVLVHRYRGRTPRSAT